MQKLSKRQRAILEEFAISNILSDFYLAGETALTIRYNHRFSEDFDFFCFPEKKINFFEFASCISPKTTIELDDKTLIILYKEIKLSFFRYDYPLLNIPEYFKGVDVQIATDEDIAAMKSVAIMQRGEKKDFFDLWYLMKHHKWNLKDIVYFCETKYLDSFNKYIFFKSLVFFEDAEIAKIPEIDMYWSEVKGFFRDMVKNFIM
jgi:predicted nucleotidyltransferase component of viral defense system